MKQMKFFLVALMTLVMGMSVTSCMKGEDSTIEQRVDFVRVNQYDMPISFKTMLGEKLVPTQAIMTAKENMALIYYQYDRSTIVENATSITITLLADPSYIKENYATTSSIDANAPVITLEPTTLNGTLKGGFFDKNTLILPIAYKYKKYENATDVTAEQGRHSFDLVFDAATGFKNGILTLHLSHVAQAILGSDGATVERADNTYEYKAFNLSTILSSLSSVPTKVNIVVDQNEKNDKFTTDTADKIFPFDYNFKK